MSQAAKRVKWCLNKAKKEIEESKKLGKKIKHRGLLKVEPNIDDARKHITKAEHNLNAISKFKEIGFSDWSIAAGFYSIYHCFLAIAAKFGYESRNQTCTIALIEWLKEENKMDIDVTFIETLKEAEIEELQEGRAIDMREDYTYGIKISVENEAKIKKLVDTSKEMIDTAKRIVFEQHSTNNP
ncbi:hypothetical protein HYY71_02365 [Candidatus Woesearchaeota archaeon]|nr:hypothetical protein [Candidatus Woesearchaeota archaeon]